MHVYQTVFALNNSVYRCVSMFVTFSDEQAVTLEAAIMKSRINMVAPGRPILKNLGLQCLMMVFTMSYSERNKFINHTLIAIFHIFTLCKSS